jgi:hypothetical protein
MAVVVLDLHCEPWSGKFRIGSRDPELTHEVFFCPATLTPR